MIAHPAPYGRKRLSGAAAMTVQGDGWHRNGLRHHPEQRGPYDTSPLVRLVASMGPRQTWAAIVVETAIRRTA